MQNNEDSYIEFVVSTLNKYKVFSDRLINSDVEVLPQDVQYVLAHYQSTKFGILLEVQRKMRLIRTIKRQYDKWWNEKVSKARAELLSKMPAGKFPALKEYSIKAQEDNVQEYDDWQEKIQQAEDEYDFVKMLKSDWDSFQFVIQILNSNMTSELKSLCMDRDYKPQRVKKE
jgi:hypothetical protein